jgi:hypothetical protein
VANAYTSDSHVEPYALALELNFTDAHPYLKRLLALDLLASLVIVYFSKGVFELTAASVPARGLGGSGTTVGLVRTWLATCSRMRRFFSVYNHRGLCYLAASSI